METKYAICQEVVYLNTAETRIVRTQIRAIRIVPTGISKNAAGKDVLDGYVVMYQESEGLWLSEKEVFASEDELRGYYRNYFNSEAS